MRWLPLIALAGCVRLSNDYYTGGGLDSGLPNADTRDDASAHDGAAAAKLDATSPSEPGSSTLDASVTSAVDAAILVDASAADPFDCNTPGVLCDDFEQGLMCPNNPAPRWSECEHIADPTGPTIVTLSDNVNHAMMSMVNAGPASRSERLLRYVPLEADYFEADVKLYAETSTNTYYTFLKLQQEAGKNPDGTPILYPGISLVMRDNVLAWVVETVQSLDQPVASTSSDMRPVPSDWVQVHLEIEFDSPLKVTISFDDMDQIWTASVAPNKLPLGRQYFTLGIYTEAAGAAVMLFDDVRAHAERDAQLIALP